MLEIPVFSRIREVINPTVCVELLISCWIIITLIDTSVAMWLDCVTMVT